MRTHTPLPLPSPEEDPIMAKAKRKEEAVTGVLVYGDVEVGGREQSGR